MMLSLLAPGVVITVASAIWIQWNWNDGFTIIDPHPSFELERVDLPSPPDGNDPLRIDVEHVLHGYEAPEDGFQLGDEHGGGDWIWSMGNGDLLQVNLDTMVATVFAHTGETHQDCGAPELEVRCGRPLGLLKLPPEDHARYQRYLEPKTGDNKSGDSEVETPLCLVADAYKGLLLVSSKGTIVPLLTSVVGTPLFFANALARARNGLVYLSDSSSRFRRNQVLLETLEGRPTGRIVSWNPDTDTSRVVADQLPFPNGLVLRNDDQSLLVALTTRHQIVEIDLTEHPNDHKSEKAPSPHRVFASLHGIPDNLHVSYSHEWNRDVLWVGTSTKSSAVVRFLNQQPVLRKVLAMLPRDILIRCFKKYGLLLALDATTGRLLHAYQDPTGTTAYIAGIHFDDSYGYIGSWKNRFLARIPRTKLFAVDYQGMP